MNNDPEDEPPALDLSDKFRVLEESREGSYAARNKGIEVARGDVLAFTDSDCIPQPQWLEVGVEALSRGADRVAGKIEVFSRSEKPGAAELYEKTSAFQQKSSVEVYGTCVTANLITYKKTFDKAGLFNSSLLSGADTEWGIRAREAGFSIVYAPQAVVRHPARDSIGKLLHKQRRVVAGQFYRPPLPATPEEKGFFRRQIDALATVLRNKDLTFRNRLKVAAVTLLLKLHKLFYVGFLLLKNLRRDQPE